MTTNVFKNSIRGIFYVAMFCIFSVNQTSFAQNWGVGGNTNQQLGQPPNPVIGTIGLNPLRIITNNVERMRIVGLSNLNFFPPNSVTTYPVTVGNIGIGSANPMSRLHIGTDATQNGGYRDWMNIGTFYQQGSDNMYVGFRNTNVGRTEAIINWGNDPGLVQGPDRLRFVFTAVTSGGFRASGTDGLEIARMVTNGNTGRMGIGNFFGTSIDPHRRLEVLDNGENAPQLRLTRTQNTNVAEGIFTDFQTTAGGNLFISPFNSILAIANRPRHVGIQTSSPARRLEVFDDRIPAGFNGTDQLRLTGALNGFADFQVTQQGSLLINPSGQPTFPPNGGPSNQFVGINLSGFGTDLPTQRLDVNGFIRERGLIGANATSALNTDGIVFSNSLGTLFTKKNFTGSQTDFLRADGVWAAPAGGGFSIGNCTTPTILSDNGNISMSGYNFLFSGAGNVGIGLTNCSPSAKLHVIRKQSSNAFAPFGGEIAARFESGGSEATFSNFNIAGAFLASRPVCPSPCNNLSMAGYFSAGNGAENSAQENYGIYTTATSTHNNYGIYASASGAVTTGGYADYAGYFDGPVVGINPSWTGSDSIFKQDVKTIDNSLSILKNLTPRTFNYKSIPGMNLPIGKSYGLIAQEVTPYIPEIVSDAIHPAKRDSAGNIISNHITYKTLNYTAIIPFLIKGIQEQQTTIDTLRDSIQILNERYSNLEARITTLESYNPMNSNSSSRIGNNQAYNNEKLKDSKNQTSQLFSCRPNPFNLSTTISYFLPEHAGNSFIGIYDMQGKEIHKFQLNTKGNSSIEVQGDNLYNGMFIYSLIVDGEFIDSKQMIMTR